jgi:hypothetical protein
MTEYIIQFGILGAGLFVAYCAGYVDGKHTAEKMKKKG